MDWSQSNNLAVGLGNTAYIWNFNTNQVNKLVSYQHDNLPTSLSWDLSSDKLIIGTLDGTVEFWDVEKNKIE